MESHDVRPLVALALELTALQQEVRLFSPQLTAFRDAAEPPIYLGVGSIRAPEDISRVAIE